MYHQRISRVHYSVHSNTICSLPLHCHNRLLHLEATSTGHPLSPAYMALETPASTSTNGRIEHTLTSFNPFSEEDQHEQSSYAIVSNIFTKLRNTVANPLSSALAGPSSSQLERKPSSAAAPPSSRNAPGSSERRGSFTSLAQLGRNAAPALVALTPIVTEPPTFKTEFDAPPARTGGGLFGFMTPDPGDTNYGTAIPGFPIADDARSVKTAASIGPRKSASVSKVIRRLRGEGTF